MFSISALTIFLSNMVIKYTILYYLGNNLELNVLKFDYSVLFLIFIIFSFSLEHGTVNQLFSQILMC